MATFYRNERREAVEVDADVVIRVLALLEVDAATEADRRRELAKLAEQASAGALAPTIAMRANGRPHPVPGAVALVGEDGSQTDVRDAVPGDVPPGFYRLHTGDGQEITLVVAPPQVPQTPVTWGWMLQLYALRSQRSWGIGDLGDLREFIGWTATAHSAGAVLVNPLHAPGPTHPVQPSPYTPSSRRFANPLALRIASRTSTPTIEPTSRRARRWMRCGSRPIPNALTTTSSGPPNALPWNCFGAPRAGPTR